MREKNQNYCYYVIVTILVFLLAGCSMANRAGRGEFIEQHGIGNGVMNDSITKPDWSPCRVYQQPLEEVRKAVIAALVVAGVDINKQNDSYVEGSVPHTAGSLGTSGGEVAGVWLESLDENSTKITVYVDTSKTSGSSSEQYLYKTIFDEMKKALWSLVFQQPLEEVRKAAIAALVVAGLDINKQNDSYVEGSRPYKAGMLGTTGGEIIGVSLESLGESITKITVTADTSKTFESSSEQYLVNTIFDEMRRVLR